MHSSRLSRTVVSTNCRWVCKGASRLHYGSNVMQQWLRQLSTTPYDRVKTQQSHRTFLASEPFVTTWKEVLPKLELAYETWGELNQERSNAVLIHSPLSLSCHVHSSDVCSEPGWWEDLVGPGKPVDTRRFFVICCSNLGGCFGTTGPLSLDLATGHPYGLKFPFVSVQDIVRSQFLLLDHLKIRKLHAAIGGSLGGMQSLCAAALYPDRVGRVVSLSAAAAACPSSIALRYAQRRAVMADPSFAGGHYYREKGQPKRGMEVARQIAMWSYRGSDEWNLRFGSARRSRASQRKKKESDEATTLLENGLDNKHRLIPRPTFDSEFEVEYYLEHHGRKWCNRYDANSMLYLSKAMDIFSVGDGIAGLGVQGSTKDGLARIQMPILVMGVQNDTLFPVWQQRDIVRLLRDAGNYNVIYYELNSVHGHDTFLIDTVLIGPAIKGHLECDDVF